MMAGKVKWAFCEGVDKITSCSELLHPEPAFGAERVAAVFDSQEVSLVGLYMHGSAALGGFGSASDLDMLGVVIDLPSPGTLARDLVSLQLDHPLELSVVSAEAAHAPSSPWPYLLHVNGKEHRWQLDDGTGDADLISHYVVTRARGVAVRGACPSAVIGEVSEDIHRDYLATELAWALGYADARYAVLNAARAQAWHQDGLVLSKVDGAHWWLTHQGSDSVVQDALEAHIAGGDLGPCDSSQMDFVEAVRGRLAHSGLSAG